ncbi:hypothetical protein K439DRAFT_485893 [Ramaria rubella]|nr:hypothetical protein K439DRAFT_485893 [Ramaria rubella]
MSLGDSAMRVFCACMCICSFILLFSPFIFLVLSLSLPLFFFAPIFTPPHYTRLEPARVASSPSQRLESMAFSTRCSRSWCPACGYEDSSGRIWVQRLSRVNSHWAGILSFSET